MKFIWLEIHSACSMEAGNIFISDLASFAAKHGFSWVGLADSNGFYGLLPFISACREKNLKALVSVRIKTPVADALLVARSMRGYAHLCRIITLGLANDAALKGEIIKNCQNNFMVISADFPLVKECRENGFAEINPLMSDYFTAYQRAHAEKLEPEVTPVFSAKDMVNLGIQEFYIKMIINGEAYDPFSAQTLKVLPPTHPSYKTEIVEHSRSKYAIPAGAAKKLIEEEESSIIRSAQEKAIIEGGKKAGEAGAGEEKNAEPMV